MDPVISIRPLLAVAVAGLAAPCSSPSEQPRETPRCRLAVGRDRHVRNCRLDGAHGAGGRDGRVTPVRDFAGDRLRFPGRCARHGVCHRLVAAVDRGGDLFHRLHAALERARADPILRLLRHQPRGGRRGRLRRQSVHAGDLLRGAQPRYLSARLPPRGRRGMDGQPQVPRLFDGRVEKRASRRAGADLPHCGVARLCGRGGCWRGSMPRRRC